MMVLTPLEHVPAISCTNVGILALDDGRTDGGSRPTEARCAPVHPDPAPTRRCALATWRKGPEWSSPMALVRGSLRHSHGDSPPG